MSDGFYRAFEERYYATRSKITELRKQYLPFVTPLTKLYPGAETFDLGCGRGEWLELMLGMGMTPLGVDLDDGMLAGCREHGLPAIQGDAVSYLRTLPSDSQATVTAFHVVEHIDFDQLSTVVSEALRVLKPGGLLIMETPNPENIVVATRNFYLDPTHLRPLPSLLLSFLPEYYGFVRTKVVRLQESKDLANSPSPTLNDVFEGASPDYAVIAQKTASAETLTLFDQAFSEEYGLRLDVLAGRYDAAIIDNTQKAEGAARHAEGLALRAEGVALRAESAALQAQAMCEQLEKRSKEAEEVAHRWQLQADTWRQQADALQQQANAWHQQIISIHQRTSWKITRPIRLVKRLASGDLSPVKRSVHLLYATAVRQAHTHPHARSILRNALNRFPGIRRFVSQATKWANPSPETYSAQQANYPTSLKSLTPRAREIYTEMTNSIKKQKGGQ